MTGSVRPAALKMPAALPAGDATLCGFSGYGMKPAFNTAQALSVERPNPVIVVDDLELRGLIPRTPAPGDRRANALTPTPEGRLVHDRAIGAVRGHEARMTGDLTEGERLALMDALRRIEVALQGEG